MTYRIQLFILLIVLAVSGCSTQEQKGRREAIQQWFVPNGKLKVLSTTSMINDLVKGVGGEYVDGLVLIEGQMDPHSYQLVKGDDEKLARAQVIFYNGLGLEHGPSLKEFLSNHPAAIPLGDKIQQDYPELILKVEGQWDPHLWMDISMWTKNLPYIAEALSQYDPAHAADYRANAKTLKEQLKAAHAAIQTRLQAIPEERRYLVTSHDAFNYFARSYLATDQERQENSWGKRFAAPEGLAPDSQLSTTDIQAIIDHIRTYRVRVIFPECSVSKDSINKIVMAARENGLQVVVADACLYSDAMGPSGSDGDTYVKMIGSNAEKIAAGFSEVVHD